MCVCISRGFIKLGEKLSCFGMRPLSCDYGELSFVRSVANAQRKNLETR